MATIEQIVERRLRKEGLYLTDDVKTQEVATEAHQMGRHGDWPHLWAWGCPICFGNVVATEKLLVKS